MDNIITMRPTEPMVNGLIQLCKDYLKPKYVGAEIGSYQGESSEIIAKHCGQLFCIDMWLDFDCPNDAATQNMAAVEKAFDKRIMNIPNIIKWKKSSAGALECVPADSLDFVYIDAMHWYEAVKGDILGWRNKVKKGGVIAGHDYYWEGVKRAVTEIYGDKIKIYPDTSWAIINDK